MGYRPAVTDDRQANDTAPTADRLGDAIDSDLVRVGRTGLEHLAKTTGKTSDSKASGAESGASEADSVDSDPDLQRLIDVWPTLPEAIRRAIMAMVETTDHPTDV